MVCKDMEQRNAHLLIYNGNTSSGRCTCNTDQLSVWPLIPWNHSKTSHYSDQSLLQWQSIKLISLYLMHVQFSHIQPITSCPQDLLMHSLNRGSSNAGAFILCTWCYWKLSFRVLIFMKQFLDSSAQKCGYASRVRKPEQ